jgi:HPt (histidine-containing phosphotransfer) domain-containing protein
MNRTSLPSVAVSAQRSDDAQTHGTPAAAEFAATPEQSEAQKKLHDLLASLWEQRRSVVLDRLLFLQQTVAALESSPEADPGGQKRKAGADVAHKLAGILGTFGLPRGTDLAREAELLLEKPGAIESTGLHRLRELTVQLGKLIEERPLPQSR